MNDQTKIKRQLQQFVNQESTMSPPVYLLGVFMGVTFTSESSAILRV
jgi:hypothetical protein